MIAKGQREGFWVMKMFCVDCGGGYVNVYICQNGCILLYVKLCLKLTKKILVYSESMKTVGSVVGHTFLKWRSASGLQRVS